MEALLEQKFRDRLFSAAFSWFSVRPQSVFYLLDWSRRSFRPDGLSEATAYKLAQKSGCFKPFRTLSGMTMFVVITQRPL